MSNPEGTASRESDFPRRTAAALLPAAWSRLLPAQCLPLSGPTTGCSAVMEGRGPQNLPWGRVLPSGTALLQELLLGCSPCMETAWGRAGWMLEVLSSTVDTCQKPLLVFSLPRGVFHQDGTTHELQNPTAQKDPQPISSPAMSSHTSTPEKPSHSRPCRAAPTCRDEEDAGTEDDVVFALVELAGRHAQASEEQQTHAEDGEDAGCSHCTCGTGSEAGSVPSIAPARRLLASPVPTPVPGKNCCNATLGCCHGAWGRPSTGPRYASLLVPELLCSELALEPSVSPANPAIQASHHKNSLNPEFLFFFLLPRLFLPVLPHSQR